VSQGDEITIIGEKNKKNRLTTSGRVRRGKSAKAQIACLGSTYQRTPVPHATLIRVRSARDVSNREKPSGCWELLTQYNLYAS